jgi:RNA polymerase sigma-70 factor (family 1)
MPDREEVYFSALQNNDENAFEALFVKHYSNLVGFVRIFMPEAGEDAGDIVSDVFGHLWINRNHLTLQGSLKAYLYAAVRNKTVDYARKYKIGPVMSKEPFEDIILPNDYTPEKELLYKEMDSHIAYLIERLPPQTKVVFRMNRDEGLTYGEVASILHISVNSVKTHMYRALKFLKESFATSY